MSYLLFLVLSFTEESFREMLTIQTLNGRNLCLGISDFLIQKPLNVYEVPYTFRGL